MDRAMSAKRDPMNAGAARLRAANLRTGLVFAAIALVFFIGVIGSEYLGGPRAALGVTGTTVLLFLILAIGRNVRK
jgi:hypothetical protein